jgi:gas vesicle protein GvpG
MLLIDDLLLAPWRGLSFVLSEIHKVVEADRAADQRRIIGELAALHRRLDEGLITEAEFEAREQPLLDRLDSFAAGEEDASSDRHE